MSIPFILEVVVGLIFIYLALSLLASEIQEIIGTLLQWRAEHLKRSIEVLITANDQESKAAAAIFTDRLYDTPLVRSLNQEATGPIAPLRVPAMVLVIKPAAPLTFPLKRLLKHSWKISKLKNCARFC